MADLGDLYRFFSQHSAGDAAPTYRAITAAIADDPELLGVVQAAPPEAHHPTMVLAAVRYLAFDEPGSDLARIYRHEAPGLDVVAAFGAFVHDHRSAIVDLLQTRRTQTNEIARTAVLAPALREVQARHGAPLALLDVGTSAGLNLLVDRVAHDYGRFTAGPDDAELVLTCTLENAGPEPGADLQIGWRRGLDRAPVDVADAAHVRWLEACLWPDQPERIERLHAAVDLMRRHPSDIVTGDAITGLRSAVADAPADLHLVVTTSWVVFYFAGHARQAFEQALGDIGRPVSWISVEHPGVVRDLSGTRVPVVDELDQSVVALVEYPGDGSSSSSRSLLAWCHPHGRWLDWE